MRMLIDGDGCPVISIVEEVAERSGIEVLIFVDTAHQIQSQYGQVLSFERGNQSVDMEIFNRCRPEDIVITQDYGLAALVLSKKAFAIDQNGRLYTEDNIDHLLMRRHIHAKMRRAGLKHSTQSKRAVEDDLKFKKALIELIKGKNVL